MRKSLPLLTIAGAAALLQTAVTLGAFAWLSRSLEVSEVGHFGLYLAVVSFVLGLDGIRQPIVVHTVSADGEKTQHVRCLAGIALIIGIMVGASLAVAGSALLPLRWSEVAPLALTAILIFAVSPGLGFLEGSKGPQFSTALQCTAWSIAIAVGAALSVSEGQAGPAAWSMMLGPFIIACILGASRNLVWPSYPIEATTRRIAFDGMRLHLVTALSGFLDRGTLASHANSFQLGLYTPLSELTSRAGALAGLIANLFLRDETRMAATASPGQIAMYPHRALIDMFFALTCVTVALSSIFARPLLNLFLARSSVEEVFAFQLLLAGLVLNAGAQWSAVLLRARGHFNLYRPYAFSFLAALALAPWLVWEYGIVGAAAIVLVVRSADIALLIRARTSLGLVQTATILTGVVSALLVIAISQFR